MRNWKDASAEDSLGCSSGEKVVRDSNSYFREVDERNAIGEVDPATEEENGSDVRTSEDSDSTSEGCKFDEGSSGDTEVDVRVPRCYG